MNSSNSNSDNKERNQSENVVVNAVPIIDNYRTIVIDVMKIIYQKILKYVIL